ncbi:MAG TPA: heavy-metal-associated domain-containing protein [Solirubrobacteraceae bacterium]|nr:heavy-metal-associated domain-containing protein [Solirubrobacteraceae bacterium]
MTEIQRRTYTVAGMTCEHCVMSVREEVGEIAGVARVDVELSSGRVEVGGERFTDDDVRAAVAEAGYEVVS